MYTYAGNKGRGRKRAARAFGTTVWEYPNNVNLFGNTQIIQHSLGMPKTYLPRHEDEVSLLERRRLLLRLARLGVLLLRPQPQRRALVRQRRVTLAARVRLVEPLPLVLDAGVPKNG